MIGTIFLSACISLVFILCLGWSGLIYYRRYREYRMTKKHREEQAQAVQQVLDQSPIITYDPTKEDTDDEPTCAICLELFKPNEKLRQLGKSSNTTQRTDSIYSLFFWCKKKKCVHIIFIAHASIHGCYLIKIVRFVIEMSYIMQYLQFHRLLWVLMMNIIAMNQHRLLVMAIIEIKIYEIRFRRQIIGQLQSSCYSNLIVCFTQTQPFFLSPFKRVSYPTLCDYPPMIYESKTTGALYKFNRSPPV